VARLVFAAVLLWAAAPTSAQTTVDGRAWWNVTVQEQPGTERPWRWYFELQGRHRDGVTGFDQLLVRPAVGYDLTPRSSLWAGYGYTPGFPPTGDVLTENRLWQQYLWAGPGLGSALQWRSRFEERSIEGNERVAWRYRQFWRLTRPLATSAGALTFVAWDELFFHLNDTARTAAGFDQNRLFAGLGLGIRQGTRVEVGYLHQNVRGVRGSADRRNHIFLTFLNATY
jgi:hypothetical protein